MRIFYREKSFSSLIIFFITATLLLSGCASNKTIETEDEVTEIDPYEDFNRDMFEFNDSLDTHVLAPVSDAYLWATPQFVQTGIANFFDNLRGINLVLNDIMQGKMEQGLDDSGRFFVNSVFGLGGLFDVATDLGLERHDEDFAQTLAVWGVPQGPYWVLPVLGPITTRGMPGGVFDAAANPVAYVGGGFGFPIQLLHMVNARANAESGLELIEEAALDPYVFTRESFLQYRNNLITDGTFMDTDDLLDLDDDFDDDEGFDQDSGSFDKTSSSLKTGADKVN